jgi:hypothetical protein
LKAAREGFGTRFIQKLSDKCDVELSKLEIFSFSSERKSEIPRGKQGNSPKQQIATTEEVLFTTFSRVGYLFCTSFGLVGYYGNRSVCAAGQGSEVSNGQVEKHDKVGKGGMKLKIENFELIRAVLNLI